MSKIEELMTVIGDVFPDPTYSGARIKDTCEVFEIRAIAEAIVKNFWVGDYCAAYCCSLDGYCGVHDNDE